MNQKEQDKSESETDTEKDLLSENPLQGSDYTHRKVHDMLLEIRNLVVTNDDRYLDGVVDLTKMTEQTILKQKADTKQMKISFFFEMTVLLRGFNLQIPCRIFIETLDVFRVF